MPMMRVNGANIHYEVSGDGPQTIVFAHGLLMSGRMFDEQVRAFASRYRCVTYDFRGQGDSEVTESGYDMETLTDDAAALIEAFGCGPCHFAGLSMGGFIGLRLAIHRPALLRSLILLETSADPEPQKIRYRMLNFIARWIGMRVVIGPVAKIMFGRKFLEDPARAGERKKWEKRILANDRVGISRATNGVIDRLGVRDDLHKIGAPTLIIVGDADLATLPATAQRMHARIAGSKLVRIPFAGHSSPIEEPETINRVIREFLEESLVPGR